MAHLRPAIVMIALFTALLGLGFPALMTGIATTVAPDLAQGSLIVRGGHVIGSALIGQNFTRPEYFHPRPSATTDADPKDPSKQIPAPYNAASSAASNYGATSKALVDRVTADVKTLGGHPPADAVTTSFSGLDPDISPANARAQAARVAAARHLGTSRVLALIDAHTEGRALGLFGEPHVNVLALNLALDESAPAPK